MNNKTAAKDLSFAKDSELVPAMDSGIITIEELALIRNTLSCIERNSAIPESWLPRINDTLRKLSAV